VLVDNSVAGICAGIEEMRAHLGELEGEIVLLQQERRKEWQGKYQTLLRLIEGEDALTAQSDGVTVSLPQRTAGG
jgi:hypothetical protein